MDLIGFQFDDVSNVFASHLSVLPITLVGSPKTLQKPFRAAPSSDEVIGTPKQFPRHPLIPSYTPVVSGGGDMQQASGVQSTLKLAETPTGQASGEF